MDRVKGKVALVTGAESADGEVVGLGRASALMLAREGAKVVATDIAPRAQGSVADEIRGAGGEAISVRHDVSAEADWQGAIEAAFAAFGRLDVVVNVAGLSQDGSVEDTELEDWRRLMAVNLDGVFLGIKHGVAAMKRSGGGSIINISSIYGSVGGKNIAAYSASKGAVRNLTKSAALHCAAAGYGIRVNSVHPGSCLTPMYTRYWSAKSSVEEGMVENLSETPMGRLGTPDDVAYGVLYLASDESSFMTGAELVIDGGFLAQ